MGAFDSIPSSGNTVGITIQVTDNNSAAVVQKVEQNLNSLGAAGKNAATGLTQVESASARMGAAVAQAGGIAAAQFAQGASAVEALSTGLAVLPGMIGIAAAGAVVLTAGLYAAYKHWFDIDQAAKDYLQTVRDAQDKDIVNVRSLEDAELRIKNVAVGATALRDLAREAQREGLGQLLSGNIYGAVGLFSGKSASEQAVHLQGQEVALTLQSVKAQHELNVQNVETQHAADAALGTQQKINAELERRKALNAEDQRYSKQLDQVFGNQASPQSGQQLRDARDLAAQRQAAAQATVLSRAESAQVIALQNAAVDAGLRGEARFAAQRQQAIAEVERRFEQGELSKQAAMAETAALARKFDNEALERIDEQMRAALDAQHREEASGLTGIPRILSERDNAIDRINEDPTKVASVKAVERQTAYEHADNQITQSNEDFQRRMREIDERAQSERLDGYGRVALEERKGLERLFDDYKKQYGDDQAAWEGYQQHKLVIEQEANRARQQLTDKTNEQIAQIDAQAARAGLPEWQRAQAEIVDQYNQRVRAAKDAASRMEITWRQEAAIEQALGRQVQVELERQAQQTRNQLAGQLQSFFDNPAKYMENRAKEMMFKILANWTEQLIQAQGPVSKLLQQLFGMGPDLPTSAGVGGIFGAGNRGGQRHPWDEHIPGLGSTTASAAPLQTAASSLTTAGTGLNSSATQLSAAATALSQAASAQASGGLGGGLGLGGDTGSSGGLGGVLNNIPGLGGGDASAGAGAGGDVFGGGLDQAIGGLTGTDAMDVQNADGSTASAGALGGVLGKAGGLIGGGLGIFSAFKMGQQATGIMGTIGAIGQGALSGLQAGAMFGPIGMAVGAIGGALAGLFGSIFGDHGLAKAKQYEQQNVKPQLNEAVWGVSGGAMDYGQAESSLTGLYSQAKDATTKFGTGARKYFNSTIGPEINAAIEEVKRQQSSARNEKVTWGAAQFDSGGFVSSFGSMATGPYTGFIHATLGERVMNPAASASYGPMLDAMNSGMYARSAQRMPVANAASGGETHLHLHALDAKSVDYWLRNGGAQRIQAHINANTGRYAGVALG